MRLRTILIPAVLVVAAPVTWLVVETGRAPAAPTPVASTPRLQPAGEDLQGLQQQVTMLRAQVAQVGARGERPAETAPDPHTPEERREIVREQQRRAVEVLDRHVNTGARDAAGSSELQAKLAGVDGATEAVVGAVSCGDALCRAEVGFPDRNHFDHYLAQLYDAHVGDFELLSQPDASGRLAVTMFVARPGHPMPDFGKEVRAQQVAAP